MSKFVLTAHQPAYLPWLGLFHKIAISDHFIFLNDVQYAVNSWQNRNFIKSASGALTLSVPVLTKGHLNKKLYDMCIANDQPWAKKHFKSIVSCYSKAYYWKRYSEFFEMVYLQKTWNKLTDLNEFMLNWFLQELEIKVPVSYMNEYNFEGKKSSLVLDMCVKMNAKKFVFGAMGKGYADLSSFEKAGVDVYFQDYKHPIYNQLYGGFISNMSIIDLLLMNGDHSYEILMSGNIRRSDL